MLITRDAIALKRITLPDGYWFIYRTEEEFMTFFQRNGWNLIYMNECQFPALAFWLHLKPPQSLQKNRVLLGLRTLGASVTENLNFVLLQQKWLFRLLINRRREATHRFHIFSISEAQTLEENYRLVG